MKERGRWCVVGEKGRRVETGKEEKRMKKG